MKQVWTQGLQRQCSLNLLQQPGLRVNNFSGDSARFEGWRAVRTSKYQSFSWNIEAIHRSSVKQSPPLNTALMFNIYLSLIPLCGLSHLLIWWAWGRQTIHKYYLYDKVQKVKTKHICTDVFKFYFFPFPHVTINWASIMCNFIVLSTIATIQ